MGKPNFSDEFKRDAMAQITERGYPLAEVSQRLGFSPRARVPVRSSHCVHVLRTWPYG